ncbi:MAG: hypothetical protein MK290_12120 [Pedosphaera sp.]|nr:hypothetical protein [Pedosphaera sp.]
MTTLGTLTPFTALFTSRSGRAFTTLGALTPFATLFTSRSGRPFTTLSTFTLFTPTAFLRDCITCHHAKTCDSHY